MQQNEYESVGEAELVRRTLAGEREAFGELVQRFADRIFATVVRIVGNREDARDLAAEAFLRAFERLHTFREGARFSTWLYTIALNLTRSELRKRKVRRPTRPVSLEGAEIDPPDRRESSEELIERREIEKLALEELANLEPEAREVVVMRDMQDLSYEEIAEVLGCPIGTVRSRLHRAREVLRERLTPRLSGRTGGGEA